MVVEVGGAVHGVDDEEYYLCLLDGEVHLAVDLRLEDVVGVDHPSACVDDGEFDAVPVDLAVLAVACGAGGGVDDGCACLCETVEEGGFAYVGAAYYCYEHLSIG